MKPELPDQIGYSALTPRERAFLDVIEELNARIVKADRLEEVARTLDSMVGTAVFAAKRRHRLSPVEVDLMVKARDGFTAALSEYRDETEGEK